MPNKKMDKKKLDQYKKLLEKAKDELAHDIRNMSEASGDVDSKDVSGHVQHMADVATDMYDREFSMSLASTEREILQKIDDALKRLHTTGYGLCVDCKKPIAEARLKAIPYAETCLKCQEKLEAKR